MWAMHDGFGWWAVMGGVGMVAFWAAILYLVFAVTQPRPESTTDKGEEPWRIAQRRLARGEIDEDEYERILAKLR